MNIYVTKGKFTGCLGKVVDEEGANGQHYYIIELLAGTRIHLKRDEFTPLAGE